MMTLIAGVAIALAALGMATEIPPPHCTYTGPVTAGSITFDDGCVDARKVDLR